MKQSIAALWLKRKLGVTHQSRQRKLILRKGLLLVLIMMLLVIAQLFVSSMIDGIVDKYVLLSNGHIQLFTAETADKQLIDTIMDNDAVIEVQQVVQGSALAYSASSTLMVRVKGVHDEYFEDERLDQITIQSREDIDVHQRNAMIVSSSMASSLNIGIGDSLALMVVPDNGLTAVRPVMAKVVGIFNSGYQELDQQLCFVSFDYAMSLFPDASSQYLELLVDAPNVTDLSGITDSLDKDIPVASIMRSWYEAQPTLYANLVVSQQMILGVFIVVALLAGFFVASIAQESIQDDKGEIAIMKLMGTTDQTVRRLYFSFVLILTICSLLIGFLLGLLLGLNMGPLLSFLSSKDIPVLSWYLMDFTIIIPWAELAILIGVLILVSVITVAVSLRRIQKITPMELLR